MGPGLGEAFRPLSGHFSCTQHSKQSHLVLHGQPQESKPQGGKQQVIP